MSCPKTVSLNPKFRMPSSDWRHCFSTLRVGRWCFHLWPDIEYMWGKRFPDEFVRARSIDALENVITRNRKCRHSIDIIGIFMLRHKEYLLSFSYIYSLKYDIVPFPHTRFEISFTNSAFLLECFPLLKLKDYHPRKPQLSQTIGCR